MRSAMYVQPQDRKYTRLGDVENACGTIGRWEMAESGLDGMGSAGGMGAQTQIS